jgi:hypothetical protein
MDVIYGNPDAQSQGTSACLLSLCPAIGLPCSWRPLRRRPAPILSNLTTRRLRFDLREFFGTCTGEFSARIIPFLSCALIYGRTSGPTFFRACSIRAGSDLQSLVDQYPARDYPGNEDSK